MQYTTQQQAAIDSTRPHNVILAGPGSGKTATLVGKIAHDFATGTAAPNHTAVITFTTAAAIEIRHRLEAQDIPAPFYIGTLHGWCLRYLTAKLGELTVLPEATANEILDHVISENAIATTAEATRKYLAGQKGDGKTKLAVKLYRKVLAGMKAADYDLLLLLAAETIAASSTETRHLYVDEFQDASQADSDIYAAMKPETSTVVGDLDQAIFGFRGGSPDHLLTAAKTPGVGVFTLEHNYRSDPQICAAADTLIAHNKNRLAKRIVPTRPAAADPAITVLEYSAEGTETYALVQAVREQTGRRMLSDIAILVRYNAERREITKALQAAGLATAAGEDRPKDWPLAIAVLGAMAEPQNRLAAIALRMACGDNWHEASEAVIASTRLGKPLHPDYMRHDDNKWRALREYGVSPGTTDRIAALSDGALTAAATMMAMREPPAASPTMRGITVATYHGSKGLEWPVVFMPACEDRMVGKKDPEESRRLFFVAITRARDELHISAAQTRKTTWGRQLPEATGGLCRFVAEMGNIAQTR